MVCLFVGWFFRKELQTLQNSSALEGNKLDGETCISDGGAGPEKRKRLPVDFTLTRFLEPRPDDLHEEPRNRAGESPPRTRHSAEGRLRPPHTERSLELITDREGRTGVSISSQPKETKPTETCV